PRGLHLRLARGLDGEALHPIGEVPLVLRIQRPRAQDVLPQPGEEAAVEDRSVVGVLGEPGAEAIEASECPPPVVAELGDRIDTGADVLTALGVVRGRRRQGRLRASRSLLVAAMESLDAA